MERVMGGTPRIDRALRFARQPASGASAEVSAALVPLSVVESVAPVLPVSFCESSGALPLSSPVAGQAAHPGLVLLPEVGQQ
jgi:hypothetical protein